MKQIFLTLTVLVALCVPALLVSGSSLAANVVPGCNNGSALSNTDVCRDVNDQPANNGNNNPIIDIIKAAIEVISFIIGIAAIIGIIVSGIRLMTAGGDSNSVASARSGIVYSLIGVAVAVLAQVIVVFVLDKVK